GRNPRWDRRRGRREPRGHRRWRRRHTRRDRRRPRRNRGQRRRHPPRRGRRPRRWYRDDRRRRGWSSRRTGRPRRPGPPVNRTRSPTMTTSIFDASRVPTVHGTVWYPMDFSRGQVIAELPDDLDPRLLPPGASPHFAAAAPASVLLLDDAEPGLIEAARRAMVPVVVLSDAPDSAEI